MSPLHPAPHTPKYRISSYFSRFSPPSLVFLFLILSNIGLKQCLVHNQIVFRRAIKCSKEIFFYLNMRFKVSRKEEKQKPQSWGFSTLTNLSLLSLIQFGRGSDQTCKMLGSWDQGSLFLPPPLSKPDIKRNFHQSCRLKLELDTYRQPHCKHTSHSCVVGCKEKGGPYLRWQP